MSDTQSVLRWVMAGRKVARAAPSWSPFEGRAPERRVIEYTLAPWSFSFTRSATLLKVPKPAPCAKLKRHQIKFKRSLS